MNIVTFLIYLVISLGVVLWFLYVLGKFLIEKIDDYILYRKRRKRRLHNHEWGPWINMEHCKRKRVCEKCGESEVEYMEHEWGEWVSDGENACSFVRTCLRCLVKESKIEHEWGRWEQEGNSPCSFVKICSRCLKKEHKVEHELGDWKYLKEKSCLAEAECTRCHEKVTEERHQYVQGECVDWGYDDTNWDLKYTYECMECARCGSRIGLSEPHVEYAKRE